MTADDFAGIDLPTLAGRLQDLMVRQDRYRREAESIGVQPDSPETFRLVKQAGEDSRTLADLYRLVELTRRFLADEGRHRPAPVLQLVPRPDAAASKPPRPGLVARTLAALGRSAAARARVA